jgi:hypothetical protein
MNKTNFTSLSLDSLTRVVGGYHDPSPSGSSSSSPKEPDDFAKQYVGKLKKDGQDWWAREKLSGRAVLDHKYGTAAKNHGAAVLDEIGAAGDLLSPILGGGVKV